MTLTLLNSADIPCFVFIYRRPNHISADELFKFSQIGYCSGQPMLIVAKNWKKVV